MEKFSRTVVLLFMLCLPRAGQAAVEGRLTDEAGNPIQRAWVYCTDQNQGGYSDSGGFFLLADVDPPSILVIFHKDFETRTIEISSPLEEPIEIDLIARRGLHHEVTVTARVPRAEFAPVGAAATRIEPGDINAPLSTLVDIVKSVPGIAENGQGGHLDVYSIRGVSGHRVRTSIGGARLAGERRAGVSASFLDPFLMGSIELTRGRHRSGALGGVVEILPRTFRGWDVSLGYDWPGNETSLLGGWGDKGWSLGFARRSAANAEAPNATELNTHFTQYSGLLSKSWETGRREFQLFLIPAHGKDIGKSNSDFPVRTTNYPRERHLLFGFSTASADLWRIETFFHPHDLDTEVVDSLGRSTVFTNSIDFGAKTTKQLFLGSRYILHLGADYFGRRSVDSEEKGPDEGLGSLENGEENEVGLGTALSIQLRRAVLEAGARFVWFGQDVQQSANVSDTALTGFTGISVPLKWGIEITGSAGSGLRFPTLSERFFSGTTGRGSVIGNPLLDSERSFNIDAGFRRDSEKFFASGSFFYTRIADYIERVDLEEDLYTFSNLTRGTIRGVEYEAAYLVAPGSSLYLRGHMMKGRDDRGTPLSDIPVHRFELGFQRREAGRVYYGAAWQFRDGKNDPGNGEKGIESAHLLSAYFGFRPIPTINTSLVFANLLNELYYPTADRKAALAAGRSVAVRVNWVLD